MRKILLQSLCTLSFIRFEHATALSIIADKDAFDGLQTKEISGMIGAFAITDDYYPMDASDYHLSPKNKEFHSSLTARDVHAFTSKTDKMQIGALITPPGANDWELCALVPIPDPNNSPEVERILSNTIVHIKKDRKCTISTVPLINKK